MENPNCRQINSWARKLKFGAAGGDGAVRGVRMPGTACALLGEYTTFHLKPFHLERANAFAIHRQAELLLSNTTENRSSYVSTRKISRKDIPNGLQSFHIRHSFNTTYGIKGE